MENQKDKLMRILGCSEAEALDIIAYDKAVDKGQPTAYDLTKEQQEVVRKMKNVDTKAPRTYTFTKRERKPNEAKREIIAGLYEFITNAIVDDASDATVTNVERQITFTLGDESFELTLVQKRKPKK